jgi:HEAT repeat protein
VAALAAVVTDSAQLVGVLIDATKDSDWLVRKSAVDSLGAVGSKAKRAVPALLELLDSEMDRPAVFPALRAIDAAEPEAIPILIERLKSPTPFVQFFAADFLGKLGPIAKDAIPELTKLTSHDNPRVRDNAQAALKKIRVE